MNKVGTNGMDLHKISAKIAVILSKRADLLFIEECAKGILLQSTPVAKNLKMTQLQ